MSIRNLYNIDSPKDDPQRKKPEKINRKYVSHSTGIKEEFL